jgi:hypothetical protein
MVVFTELLLSELGTPLPELVSLAARELPMGLLRMRALVASALQSGLSAQSI